MLESRCLSTLLDPPKFDALPVSPTPRSDCLWLAAPEPEHGVQAIHLGFTRPIKIW